MKEKVCYKDANLDGQFNTDDDDFLLADFDYVLRDDGRREQVTERYFPIPGAIGIDPEEFRYEWNYDDLGRLVNETRIEVVNSTDSLDYRLEWGFDLNGNRLEQLKYEGQLANPSLTETTTYTYNANDQLLTEVFDEVNGTFNDYTATYGYTGTLQTSKVKDGSSNSEDSLQEFEYDVRGRMELVKTTRFAQFGGPANFYSETSERK